MDVTQGSAINLQFTFTDLLNNSTNLIAATTLIYDNLRNLVKQGSMTSTVGVTGSYDFTFQVPSTATLGTYFAMAYGSTANNLLYSEGNTFRVVNFQDRSFYVTLNEVKTWMSIALSDTSKDSVIKDLILAGSEWIRSYLQVDFGVVKQYSDTFFDVTDADDTFVLNYYPVYKVISTTPADLTYTMLSNIGSMKIASGDKLTHVPYNIDITYQAGFLEIPEPVRLATKKLVSALYQKRGSEGLNSERLGDFTQSFDSDLFKEVRDILISYRRVRI